MGLLWQGGKAKAEASATLASADAEPGRVAQAVERVLQFVPTEVVGLYVALTGVIQPKADWEKWALFALGATLVPTFLWLGAKLAATSGGWADSPTRKLVHLTWMGILAFTAWVAALPDTPFVEVFGSSATRWGTCALLILAALLPLVERRLARV